MVVAVIEFSHALVLFEDIEGGVEAAEGNSASTAGGLLHSHVVKLIIGAFAAAYGHLCLIYVWCQRFILRSGHSKV